MSEPTTLDGTLVQMLHGAGKGQLPEGWLFLRDEGIRASTQCLLLSGFDVGDLEPTAKALGFPLYGLDTAFLRIIYETAEEYSSFKEPSDDCVVQTYLDQRAFDVEANRRFYKALGPERPEVPCRHERCERGAVSLSVFCRPHHFESIHKRPSPFRH